MSVISVDTLLYLSFFNNLDTLFLNFQQILTSFYQILSKTLVVIMHNTDINLNTISNTLNIQLYIWVQRSKLCLNCQARQQTGITAKADLKLTL